MYGYSICKECVSKLRLFTDKTIKEHITKYKRLAYEDEVNNKLLLLNETYIKKKIKLLHILDRLQEIR